VAAFVPVTAYAQGSITGVVRDTSGAVLPGVTVEVASPSLIEKVRVTVSDDTGRLPGCARNRGRSRSFGPWAAIRIYL
jgi:hypothetical protein